MDTQKKYSIAIVDDDSFLLDMYSVKFSQSGFDVSMSLGANQLIALLQGGKHYDAMIVDLVMPGIDGFQLLEKIKNENLAIGAVKIVLSNLGASEDIQRCKDLGVDGYIVKANATPNEVVEKVKETLYKKYNTTNTQ